MRKNIDFQTAQSASEAREQRLPRASRGGDGNVVTKPGYLINKIKNSESGITLVINCFKV